MKTKEACHYLMLISAFSVACFLFAFGEAIPFRNDKHVVNCGFDIPRSVVCHDNQTLDENLVESAVFNVKKPCFNDGESAFVIELFIQYRQTSTNFSSYAFAKEKCNSELSGIKIHFLNGNGCEIISLPCSNDGQDIAWAMDGSRIVQLCASFILTDKKFDLLNSMDCHKFYLSDRRGNLMTDAKRNITHSFGKKELDGLTTQTKPTVMSGNR